jgi:hypothetical protein
MHYLFFRLKKISFQLKLIKLQWGTKSMWQGQPIQLNDWAQFAGSLRTEILRIRHESHVLVRNFDLLTYELGENNEIIGEANRLDLVLKTGTDRDSKSPFWNDPKHDFQHDSTPSGKQPEEIIYAHLVDTSPDPYVVYICDTPEALDLTLGLSDQNGILIYDSAHLRRVSKNEHWFKCDPRHALLAVFHLVPDT